MASAVVTQEKQKRLKTNRTSKWEDAVRLSSGVGPRRQELALSRRVSRVTMNWLPATVYQDLEHLLSALNDMDGKVRF